MTWLDNLNPDSDFVQRYGPMLDRLSPHEFQTSALFAAHELEVMGFAYIHLEPRDGTRYEFCVICPPTNGQWYEYERGRNMPHGHPAHRDRPAFNEEDHYLVAHSIRGALYPWHGTEVHPDYAFEKWTSGRAGTPDEWTAYIVARFLTELSVAIRERRERADG